MPGCTHLGFFFFSISSILLVEKVRKYAFTNASSKKASHKYENFLGGKVLTWFAQELKGLSTAYGTLDGAQTPLAYSTFDTMKENPDMVERMHVAAVLDKKSARDVISQIAMITRLKAILLKNSEVDLRQKILRAMKSSAKLQDEWEKKPDWWDDSTNEHSFLLLTRLDEYGLGDKFIEEEKARYGFGAADMDYNDMVDLQLTKPAVQIRANQLVRELNNIEDHEEMMRVVQNRKKNLDSLAMCHNGSSSTTPSSSGKKKKGTIQTGLKAFFSASTSSSSNKKSKAAAAANSDENSRNGGSPDSLASIGKRKESPLHDVDASGVGRTSDKKKKAKVASAAAKAQQDSGDDLVVMDVE
jgi:hypothetical protein